MGQDQELKRSAGWELRLSQFLKDLESTPFQWGENDCALMSANGVQAVTGVDVAAEFRGQYSTKSQAAAIIAQHGDLEGLITYCMGFGPDENWRTAARGDVVVVDTQGQMAAGIVDDTGQRIAVITTNNRLERLSVKKALKVWRY